MRAVTHVHSVCGEWDFASPQAARWFAVQLQYELVFYELGMPFTPGRDAREEFADTLFFWEAPASDASAEAVGNCLAASGSLAFQPSSSQHGHRGSDVADEARAPPKHGKDPQLGPGLGFPVCSEGSADACTDLGWVYSAPVFRAPCASQSATPVVHPSALASGSPAIPLRVCFEDGPTRTCNVFRRAFNNTAAARPSCTHLVAGQSSWSSQGQRRPLSSKLSDGPFEGAATPQPPFVNRSQAPGAHLAGFKEAVCRALARPPPCLHDITLALSPCPSKPPTTCLPAQDRTFPMMRLHLASRIPVFPSDLDRPEQRQRAVSSFAWITGFRATGAVQGSEGQFDRFVIYDSAVHVQTRPLPRGWDLDHVVAELLGIFPRLKSVRFLQRKLPNLPSLQVAVTMRDAPPGQEVLPLDFRHQEGRICTVRVSPGMSAEAVYQVCIRDCPHFRLPRTRFALQDCYEAPLRIPHEVDAFPDFGRGVFADYQPMQPPDAAPGVQEQAPLPAHDEHAAGDEAMEEEPMTRFILCKARSLDRGLEAAMASKHTGKCGPLPALPSSPVLVDSMGIRTPHHVQTAFHLLSILKPSRSVCRSMGRAPQTSFHSGCRLPRAALRTTATHHHC